MKTASTQYPLVADVEVRPLHDIAMKPHKLMGRETVMAYVTKLVVVVSCLAMMFGLLNYGRIFEHYLQW
jgi:hypothetical protein